MLAVWMDRKESCGRLVFLSATINFFVEEFFEVFFLITTHESSILQRGFLVTSMGQAAKTNVGPLLTCVQKYKHHLTNLQFPSKYLLKFRRKVFRNGHLAKNDFSSVK